jgi:adenylate cyclase
MVGPKLARCFSAASARDKLEGVKRTKQSPRLRTERALERLLDARNEHPERLGTIDAQIRANFERTCAIFVLDMCGFSRLTIRHGIIHYLAMIRRMQHCVLPLVETCGGTTVKTEADNVFAVFPSVPNALRCARLVQRQLQHQNESLPEDWDVHVGIGIGYGPVLMVGAHDLYGAEMNLASKLGEDLAGAGDVLLTEAAHARAGTRAQFSRHRKRVSGLTLTHYRVTGSGPR